MMHPGPMNEGVEIAPDVAAGAHSVITDQVTNGVAVRMAMLYLLAGTARRDRGRRDRSGARPRDQPGLAGGSGAGPRGTGRDRRPRRDPRGRHVARRVRTPTESRRRRSSSRPGSSIFTRTSASPATRTPRRSRPAWRRPPTAGSRRSARCRTRPGARRAGRPGAGAGRRAPRPGRRSSCSRTAR